MGASHENDIVGIVLAYLGNNRPGIRFQAFPRVVYGLVVEFVDDIGIFAIFPGHLSEEVFCFFGVHVVCVPVDDDIEAVLDGRLDDRGDAADCKLGILQIVVVYLHSHGGTHHCGVPVVGQPLHRLLVVEPWPQVVPAQTDSPQYDGLPLVIAQLCAFHLQLSPLFHRFCRLNGLQRQHQQQRKEKPLHRLMV